MANKKIKYFVIIIIGTVSIAVAMKTKNLNDEQKKDKGADVSTIEKEHEAYFQKLKNIKLLKNDIEDIKNKCLNKFKSYKKINNYEVLEPVILTWSVDISINYNNHNHQYSCLYTTEKDLLQTVAIDENGIKRETTKLQEKYNF